MYTTTDGSGSGSGGGDMGGMDMGDMDMGNEMDEAASDIKAYLGEQTCLVADIDELQDAVEVRASEWCRQSCAVG